MIKSALIGATALSLVVAPGAPAIAGDVQGSGVKHYKRHVRTVPPPVAFGDRSIAVLQN